MKRSTSSRPRPEPGGAPAEAYRPLDLARRAAEHLASRGIEDARLEAELLLAGVLGLNRLELYLQYERPLTGAEVSAYRDRLRRRLRREPVQYILGDSVFRELRLAVDARVLVPRPETEVLAGEVLRWAGARPETASRGLRALDIGTGSGAIALSLLREGPFDRVVATDVSERALELARENAGRHGLADRIELRVGSVWDAVAPGSRFDVVVSNPPYIAEAERDSLPPEVRDWEPAAALIAGPTGFEVLDAIVDGGAEHLEPGGLLALEVGAGQAEHVAGRLDAAGEYAAVRVARDLSERDRVVLAERKTLAIRAGKRDHARD